ncbi:unnamed protein product [Ixodes pacificus]
MPFCAVGGCFTKQGDGKRLLRFPLAEKDRERLRAWLELVDRENFQTTPNSRICEVRMGLEHGTYSQSFRAKDMELSMADGEKMPWGYFETSEHHKYLDTSRPLDLEQQCKGQQCVHQATVTELQRKLNLQQQRIRKLEKELEAVLGSRHENLAPEQQFSTMNQDAHGNRWRNDTVQKVLLRSESRKDELPKDEVIPLISERTLQRQIREIQSEPGVYTSVSCLAFSLSATDLPIALFKEFMRSVLRHYSQSGRLRAEKKDIVHFW